VSALRDLANRFPRLKAAAKAVLAPLRGGSVSSHYVELADAEAEGEAARLRGAWQDESIPGRQRELVDRQLAAFRRGEAIDNFDVMVQSLRDLGCVAGPMSILEIGCSSGYYSEIITPVEPGFAYAGCDYSPAFIKMARRHYPTLPFDVEDATRLSYANSSFDVVVSGCCLLHIPEYSAGVSETARVAKTHAIFHRTPVVVGQPEKVYRKHAYGIETVEIHFNEPAFLDLLAVNGLELIATHTLSETVSAGIGSAVRTYVCRKVPV
jgi:SAM-dependent methyltransferase